MNLSGRVTQAELRTENYGVDKLVGNVSVRCIFSKYNDISSYVNY